MMSSEKATQLKMSINTMPQMNTLRNTKSRGLTGSVTSIKSDDSNSNKRAATSPLKIPSLKDPLPVTLKELDVICENVFKHKRSLRPEMTSEGMLTAGKAIIVCFNQVVEAYRTLALKVGIFDEIYDAVKGNNTADELQALKDDIKSEIAEMVKQEVTAAIADSMQHYERDRMEIEETQQGMKDIVANEVQQAVTQLKDVISTGTNLTAERCATKSYAEASKVVSFGNSQVRIESGDKASRKTVEFLVVPMVAMATNFQSSLQIKSVFTTAISAIKYNIRAIQIFTLPNKAIRIIAEPFDIGKLKNSVELRNAGLMIKEREKLRPRLIVRSVPNEWSNEQFIESLILGNVPDVSNELIKVKYKYPVKTGRDRTSVVIETDADVRARLILTGRVYLGYESCRISDHLQVKQCFKCLKFGHITSECKNSEACGKCAGKHATRECDGRNPLKCCNCVIFGHEEVTHSAYDEDKCPVLRRKMIEKARSINYACD